MCRARASRYARGGDEPLLAPPAPALAPSAARPAFALCLLAYAALVVSVILQGAACGWRPSAAALHLEPYRWARATADVAAATLATLLLGSVLVCSPVPTLGAVLNSFAGGAAVTKVAMLAGDVPATARLAAAADALASLSVAVACILVARERRAAAVRRADGAATDPIVWGAHVQADACRVLDEKATDGVAGDGADGGVVEGKGKRKPREAGMGRMFGLARPEAATLGGGLLAMLVSTASTMALPSYVGQMFGVIAQQSEGQHGALREATLTLAVIFAVGGLCAGIRGYLFTVAGERIVARLRIALFERLVVQDIAFFDANQTGELMNRLASDTAMLQNAVTVNMSMGLRFGAQVLIGLCLIFFTSWRLSLVMLAIVPLVVAVAVRYGKFMKRKSRAYQKALSEASVVAQEVFSSIRTVRSFAMESRERDLYSRAVADSYALGRDKACAYGGFGALIQISGQSAVLVVLWYGGTLVLGGRMLLSELTTFLLLTITITASLAALSDFFGSIMNALGASIRVFKLLDGRPSIRTSGGTALPSIDGLIELRAVSFAYPARADVRVLREVDMTITPGSVVALCGPSGAGKSTVVGMIQRWYDPTSGSIHVDGTPLSQLDPSWWRRQMALVAQEPVLFACSILDNVAYGVAGADAADAATRAAVEQACATANAIDFVRAFPDGLDTGVGERGVQLSGGQKQRIAIARALLVEPKVLLLDEATSALDAESERLVQQAIDRLMLERTTLVIAHRLSTVVGADSICVFSGGTIAERGTHAELVKLGGIYYSLVQRQLTAAGPAAGAAAPPATGASAATGTGHC